MDPDKNGNPFRPNSTLYKEADEVVNLIKQGKLTPSPSPAYDQQSPKKAQTTTVSSLVDDQADGLCEDKKKAKKDKNRSKKETEVEVNKSIIQDKDPSYAEHVLLPEDEKKKHSKCCVIQ